MEASSLQASVSRNVPSETGGSNDDGLNSSFLEFLTDDLAFGSEALDSATLEAVCKVADSHRQPTCQLSALNTATFAGPVTMPASGLKRPMDEAPYSESDDEEESGKGEKSVSKRSKGAELSAAATKKACREKARREKLNERFLDLARLVDPGSEPKTDKNTILTDTIKYVQQTTIENHQLRQLNKFLEERVSSLERERGHQLYQQSLMMSAMGHGQMVPAAQALMVGAPAGIMQAPVMAGAAMGHAHLHMPTAMVTSASNPMMNVASLPSASTPPLPSIQSQQAQQQQQSQQQQAGVTSFLAQASGGLRAQTSGTLMPQIPLPGGPVAAMGTLSATGMGNPGVAFNMHGASLGAGPSKPVVIQGMGPYQGMYWLPPQMMDSTQDSLLRPPAA